MQSMEQNEMYDLYHPSWMQLNEAHWGGVLFEIESFYKKKIENEYGMHHLLINSVKLKTYLRLICDLQVVSQKSLA